MGSSHGGVRVKASRNAWARRTVSVALLLCAFTLVGCGRKEQASKGQVVAHIGDQVITTSELENELRLANVPAEQQKDPVVLRQVLSELVLRKYLVDRALNSKLDREPSVLLDILRSKDQVLAAAAASRAVAAQPTTQADIDRYIAEHPSKFANRRIITADEIVFPLGLKAQAVIDASKEANSLDEIDQKLTTMTLAHNRSVGVFNTGEMTEDLLNVMQGKSDNVFFMRAGPNGVFFKVRAEEAQPLQGEAAINAARQSMRADRLKAETGMASVSANLDAKYEGEYAAIMNQNAQGPSKKTD
jgi:EpsD family peptidyl-prolyl cis-trans isomerase